MDTKPYSHTGSLEHLQVFHERTHIISREVVSKTDSFFVCLKRLPCPALKVVSQGGGWGRSVRIQRQTLLSINNLLLNIIQMVMIMMMIILPRIQRPTLLSNNILLLNMMMMVMIMMRITLDILTKVCHQLVMMKILQLPFWGQSYPIYDLVGLLSVFNYNIRFYR